MNGLEQLVGTLAFPIAITVYLLVERNNIRKENREDKINTTKMFTDAFNENTRILAELKILIQERLKD